MSDDVQRLLSGMKHRVLVTAIAAAIPACAITFGFYSSGHAMATASGGELALRQTTFGLVLMAGAASILWCICIQYAEAYLFTRFITKLLVEMSKDKERRDSEEGQQERKG